MRAGLGSIDITPGAGAYLAGYGNRDAAFTDIHDPLTARALVVEDALGHRTALIVLDLLALDFDQAREIGSAISAATGIDPAAILVTATHTHSGPACVPGRLGPEPTAEFLLEIVSKAVLAAEIAHRGLRPVELRGAIGHEPSVGKNRRVVDGITDPELPVVVLRDPESLEVFGVLCSYACHPVVLGPQNLSISADYPAVVRTSIEKEFPGSLAIFATGCAGQINTGHRAGDAPDAGANRRTFAEAERLGGLLAAAALSAIRSARPASSASLDRATVSFAREEVALPRVDRESPEEVASLRTTWLARLADAGRLDAGELNLLRIQLEWAEAHADAAAEAAVPDLLASVTVLRWGDTVVVGLPGEPFVELGLSIKSAARAVCAARSAADDAPVTAVVLGYANGCVGYVPNRDAYADGGYEVSEAHRFYNEPSALAPEAGERLVTAATRCIDRVMRSA